MAKAGTFRKTAGHNVDRNDAPGTRGVHPLVIRAAVVASAWFVIAMAISFSGGIEADYLFGVVVGFSIIFFTLVLGLAGHSAKHMQGEHRDGRLIDFLDEDVAIDRGSVSGREATIQILMLPITLAIGATIIGFIFVVVG